MLRRPIETTALIRHLPAWRLFPRRPAKQLEASLRRKLEVIEGLNLLRGITFCRMRGCFFPPTRGRILAKLVDEHNIRVLLVVLRK